MEKNKKKNCPDHCVGVCYCGSLHWGTPVEPKDMGDDCHPLGCGSCPQKPNPTGSWEQITYDPKKEEK